jgi:hypothetical protein
MERSVKQKKKKIARKTWILIIKTLIIGLIVEIYDIVSVIYTYYVSTKIKSI